MDKKKIIITGLIIIILASCLILIVSQNNTKDSDNYNRTNSTTKSNISNDTTKNGSFNTNQITKSGKDAVFRINNYQKSQSGNAVSRINDNQTTGIEEKRNYTVNQQFNQKNDSEFSPTNNNSNISNESKLIKVTPEDIKKRVEGGVRWPGYGKDEVVIGEPYLKRQDPTGTTCTWLVPAFNKTSGDFIGAVYVGSTTYKNSDGKFGSLFYHGVDSFSDYLTIISGGQITYPKFHVGNITVIGKLTTLENGVLNGSSNSFNEMENTIVLDNAEFYNIDLSEENIDLNNSSKSYSE